MIFLILLITEKSSLSYFLQYIYCKKVLQDFYKFLSQKVNRKSKNGQKKCPILKRGL